MQIGKAARGNGSHIKSRLKMEPYGVFKEVTKQCTNKDHYQSVSLSKGDKAVTLAHFCAPTANFAVRYTKSLTKVPTRRSLQHGEKKRWVVIVNVLRVD
jgi:hypothetical protein